MNFIRRVRRHERRLPRIARDRHPRADNFDILLDHESHSLLMLRPESNSEHRPLLPRRKRNLQLVPLSHISRSEPPLRNATRPATSPRTSDEQRVEFARVRSAQLLRAAHHARERVAPFRSNRKTERAQHARERRDEHAPHAEQIRERTRV